MLGQPDGPLELGAVTWLHQRGEEMQMTFGESISRCFSKYADFNGRASKPEF